DDDLRMGARAARARRWCWLALAAVVGPGVGFADPPARPSEPQPDAELLEFLGSVDSADTAADDGAWIEYLAQADIDKAAKKPASAPPDARANDKTTDKTTGSDAKQGASKVKPDGQ